jgi:peptide/nickel transport system permease protein
MVAATFGVASVVLIEASLDFLHVGLPETAASWGESLGEARDHWGAWWLFVFPGAMVFLTVAALNLVGEAMRDALDPRLRDAAVRTVEAEEEGAPPSVAAFDEGTRA